MRLWHLVVLLALAGIYFWSGPASTMPAEYLVYYDKTSAEKPGKRRLSCMRNHCLTIYLTPWCPYCRKSHAAILDAVKQLEERGITTTIILGMDKPDALVAYAADFPFPVYFDANNAYFKKLGMKGVPHSILWLPGGKIVNNESGGFSSADTLFHVMGLQE